MPVIKKLEDFPKTSHSIVLTIGNFDGMHRGHCAVLKQAQALVGKEGKVVVLTFINHPSEILRPETATPLLCTLPHKLYLLENFGIQTIILLPFTRYLAQHSARSFIENVRQYISFAHLVLGHDATLGRDRQGNPPTINNLGMEWGFDVHYLEAYRYEGKPVSSTRIREILQQGDLNQVEELLGRPYSIYGNVVTGKGKGASLGFPTANLNVKGLCLPPFGVYAVEVCHHSKFIRGIANLGIAPTMNDNREPVLEVHLFNEDQDFVGQTVEVIFKEFIRPEMKFEAIENLRDQISKDIERVKSLTF